MNTQPSKASAPRLSFAQARALKREIHAAALDVRQNLRGSPKCVVLTETQYRALLMTEGGESLVFEAGRNHGAGRLRMVSDAALGKPLPEGQWQILDFVPRVPVARDLVATALGDVLVSTIDLGASLDAEALETCFPADEPRYEVYVSSDPDSSERRYVKREEALAAHAATVKWLSGVDTPA